MIRTSTLLMILIFAALASVPVATQAQTDRRPAFALFRWLGNGYSDGYHTRNPGPDSSYYNPYSLHNSNRVFLPTEGSPVLPLYGFGARQPASRPTLQSSWARPTPSQTDTRVAQTKSVLVTPVLEGPVERSQTNQTSLKDNDYRRPRRPLWTRRR